MARLRRARHRFGLSEPRPLRRPREALQGFGSTIRQYEPQRQNQYDHEMSDSRAAFQRILKHRLKRCMAPPLNHCKERAIDAHSVRRSKTLGLIEEEGHVVVPQIQLKGGDGPVLTFKSVGWRRATTFTGLCKAHDQEFESIDKAELDPPSARQLVLLAYRAFIREFHAKYEAVERFKKVDAQGMEVVRQVEGLWHLYRYGAFFEMAFAHGESLFSHRVVAIDEQAPVLAAANMLCPCDVTGEYLPLLSMTVTPVHETRTIVAMTWLQQHDGVLNRSVGWLLQSPRTSMEQAVSSALVTFAENLALRPSHVDSWPEQFREDLLHDLLAPVTGDAVRLERGSYNLFQSPD